MNPGERERGRREKKRSGGGRDVQPSLTCKEFNTPLITLIAIFHGPRFANSRSLFRSLFFFYSLTARSLSFSFIVKCIKTTVFTR